MADVPMPELPEVETVRRGLERALSAAGSTAVEVGRERTVRRTSADAVIDGLTGTTLVGGGPARQVPGAASSTRATR